MLLYAAAYAVTGVGYATFAQLQTLACTFAIGAIVAVLRRGQDTLRRFVRTDSSYLSSNDVRVHFGLGKVTQVDQVMVRWPDGTRQDYTVEDYAFRLYKHMGGDPSDLPLRYRVRDVGQLIAPRIPWHPEGRDVTAEGRLESRLPAECQVADPRMQPVGSDHEVEPFAPLVGERCRHPVAIVIDADDRYAEVRRHTATRAQERGGEVCARQTHEAVLELLAQQQHLGARESRIRFPVAGR